nr:hypothetical protein CFP56_33458 [Quercus suber]
MHPHDSMIVCTTLDPATAHASLGPPANKSKHKRRISDASAQIQHRHSGSMAIVIGPEPRICHAACMKESKTAHVSEDYSA